MRIRSVSTVVFSLLLAFPALAGADLVGQWTFEPEIEFEDLSGNWASLTLNGATVEDGQLNLDMAPITWAIAEGYTGPNIVSKTLVSWISLDDLTNPSPAGSAISIDRVSSDMFDGVVFGERQPGRWMNGSSFYQRTQDFSPGFEETATRELIQLAYTYEDMGGHNVRITGYRNGEQIGQYAGGSLASWSAGDANWRGSRLRRIADPDRRRHTGHEHGRYRRFGRGPGWRYVEPGRRFAVGDSSHADGQPGVTPRSR